MSLHLFEGYGIELEYMIVDRTTLQARPIADLLLEDFAGAPASDLSFGDTAWSNELVQHVIELKTDGPAPRLSGLADLFQRDLRRINQALEKRGAAILPTAMHPWFDPAVETKIWPHEYTEVYRTFDRIDLRWGGDAWPCATPIPKRSRGAPRSSMAVLLGAFSTGGRRGCREVR